jgi:hypothetical protein
LLAAATSGNRRAHPSLTRSARWAVNNVAPDAGLSAPFNSMFTFFGQFFDHGLDLVNKGSGIVSVPLQADDPLVTHGPDGIAGNGDEQPVGTPMMLSRAPPRARQLGSRQPDDSVRRPEPDLHLARVAPGVPARLRDRRGWKPAPRPAASSTAPAATSATGPRSRPMR